VNQRDRIRLAELEYTRDISLDTRTIYYAHDEIFLSTPSDIATRINLIRRITGSEDPITIELSCSGGDVYGMFGTLDYMKKAPVLINMHGRGAIMSAATLLLAACPGCRSLSASALLMIHEVSTWVVGKTSDVQVEARHLEVLQARACEVYAQHTKRDIDFWSSIRKNLYLTAEEALEYGFVDEVVEEDVA